MTQTVKEYSHHDYEFHQFVDYHSGYPPLSLPSSSSCCGGKQKLKNSSTFVTGSSVAACENATSVNDAGSGLVAKSAAKVRL